MYVLHVLFLNFWSGYAAPIAALFTNDFNAWLMLNQRIFPKLAKCLYTKTGSSGSSELRDSLCFLPLNVLNEKIFAFIYMWYILIIVLTTFSLMCSIFAMASKRYRISRLRAIALLAFSGDQMCRITNQANYGDVFVLKMLGRNLTSYLYLDLMNDLLAMRKTRRVSFFSEEKV